MIQYHAFQSQTYVTECDLLQYFLIYQLQELN